MTTVPVTVAKAQLTELMRRAEAGEEIVITRHGHPAVQLVPARRTPTPAERLKALEAILGVDTDPDGPSAARSHDFLYGDDGLPA